MEFVPQLRTVGHSTIAYHWHNDLKGRYQRCAKVGQDPTGVQNVDLQTRKGLTLVVQASKTTKILYLDVNIAQPSRAGEKGRYETKKTRLNKL